MRKDIVFNKSFKKVELHFFKKSQLSESKQQYFTQLLTAEESERVNGFRTEEMKQDGLWVRASLRELLSEYCQRHKIEGVEPHQWQFGKQKYGKPYVQNQPSSSQQLVFNLSHSGDWLMIGVTHRAVNEPELFMGVDIEYIRNNTKVMSIAKRYFSPLELAGLEACEIESKQKQRFFDLWVCKESFIKATGKGLATDLTSFSFDFQSCEIQQTPDNQLTVNLQVKQETTIDWESNIGWLDDAYRYAVTIGV